MACAFWVPPASRPKIVQMTRKSSNPSPGQKATHASPGGPGWGHCDLAGAKMELHLFTVQDHAIHGSCAQVVALGEHVGACCAILVLGNVSTSEKLQVPTWRSA